MLGDAAQAVERRRRDAHAEMRFTLGARSGVTGVAGAFINHFKVDRREFCGKFCNNGVANRHMGNPLWGPFELEA
jgi:hypothetical protein